MREDVANPLFKASDLMTAAHIVENNKCNFIPKYVPGQRLQRLYYILKFAINSDIFIYFQLDVKYICKFTHLLVFLHQTLDQI